MPDNHHPWRISLSTWLVMLGMAISGVAWAVTQSARISAVESRYMELLVEVRGVRKDWLQVAGKLEAISINLARIEAQQAIWHSQEPATRRSK